MFRPPSVFFAAGRVTYVQRCLEAAGHPIPVTDCRKMVALAYGYRTWWDLLNAMAKDLPASPFNEDLEDEIEVAARHPACIDAIREVTGLPLPLCASLADSAQFTGDPTRRTIKPYVDQDAAEAGLPWMTPERFRFVLDHARNRP